MTKKTLLAIIILTALLSSCGGGASEPTLDLNPIMTLAFATVNASGTQTALAMPTNTPTETPLPTPTFPPQPTAFAPTVILPATVTTGANVRFGPGTQYAGPGGLRYGKVLEVIGRNAAGDWLLVREVGGQKSSWVYAPNLTVQGDIASLAIAPVVLPITPNYQAPTNIKVARAGDQVQVSWDAVTIQPKDIYLESTYFIEAWVCSAGQIVYNIYATKDVFIVIPDQPGCAEASRGNLYTTTREGYSQPAAIPWPTP